MGQQSQHQPQGVEVIPPLSFWITWLTKATPGSQNY